VFYGLLQQQEQMNRIAVSMIIKGPLSLMMLACGLYFTGSVAWAAAGLALAWLIVLVAFDLRNGQLALYESMATNEHGQFNESLYRKVLRPIWKRDVLMKLVWLALPLGVVALLVALNTNIPRYFIQHYLDERALGIFAAMTSLTMIDAQVVNALGQSASPKLSQYYAAGNGAAFRSLSVKLICMALLIGAIMMALALLVGGPVLSILYGPEYSAHIQAFLWIMAASWATDVAQILGYSMTAARYFKAQMPVFLLQGATAVISCVVLVPNYHLVGAAIAMLCAMTVQLIGSGLLVVHAVYAIRPAIRAAYMP
jgi:O-antigen/teichoic acid export membrane protein